MDDKERSRALEAMLGQIEGSSAKGSVSADRGTQSDNTDEIAAPIRKV
jgi:hypothetical protein